MYSPCVCKCELSCDLSPIVWGKIGRGYTIVNLPEKYYHLALMLIEENYLPDNILFKSFNFANDEKSVHCLTDHMLDIMSAGNSLIMIDTRDNSLVGVLLLSIVNKLEFGRVYSHTNMQQGDAYEQCIALQNHIHRNVDFFLDYGVEKFMRVYLLCIADEHRHKKLGYHLMRAGLEVARHMRVPIACWLTSTEDIFDFARKFEFESACSLAYTDWFESYEDEDFVMPNPRHHLDLMVAKVPEFYVTPIAFADKSDKTKKKPDRKKEKKDKKGKKKK